ncbi:MAG: leucine-rich repeat domain-containing protein [Candidatus Heimdallarchaeota archaeon]|nr:leucine-rich repeat domain-containing protein [Candidatus Heimdallarchaeota archaeon]
MEYKKSFEFRKLGEETRNLIDKILVELQLLNKLSFDEIVAFKVNKAGDITGIHIGYCYCDDGLILAQSISECKELKELIVEANKIDIIFPWLSKLGKLSILSIRSYLVNELHPSITVHPTLQTFILKGKVENIPAGFIDWLKRCNEVAIQSETEELQEIASICTIKQRYRESLVFYRDGLAIAKLNGINYTLGETKYDDVQKVETISLKGRKLVDLPEIILEFKDIYKLDLSHNLFREIPKELKSLKKLESLFLNHNAITTIDSIKELKKLKLLHLGNNQIQEFENMDHKGLLELYLRNNKLQQLTLTRMPKLRRLAVDSNNLENLTVKNSSLTHLYVDSNNLAELNVEFVKSPVRIDIDSSVKNNPESMKLLQNLEISGTNIYYDGKTGYYW